MRSERRGFILIEVLVALVLIHVGLLTLVAASAMIVRRTTETRAEAAVLQAASIRIETLAAKPCVASNGLSTGALGLREDWSAQLAPLSTLAIRDSVSYGARSSPRTIVLHAVVSC